MIRLLINRVLCTLCILVILTISAYIVYKMIEFIEYTHLMHEVERMTSQSLEIEGREQLNDYWVQLSPLTSDDGRMMAKQAMILAQSIVETYPGRIEPLRQLSRTAILAGRTDIAVAALSKVIERHPDHSLVWFELGMAYEQLSPYHIIEETITHSADRSIWGTIQTSSIKQEWSLPVVDDGLLNWWSSTEKITRTVLIGEQLAIRAKISENKPILSLWIATLTDQAITYQIIVDGFLVSVINLSNTNLGWHYVQVDLTPWTEKTIDITLRSSLKRTGWADIQLIDKTEIDCIRLDCLQRAVLAWRRGGFTAQDFLHAGMVAFQQKQYNESLLWYSRYIILGHNDSDIWYHIGRVFEESAKWEKALNAYQYAIDRDEFVFVSKSTLYLHMGEIYHGSISNPQYDKSFDAFVSALVINDFKQEQEKAQCYYRLGEIYWWKNDVDRAITYFQKALELNPHHDWANIRIGVAYFYRDKDLQSAQKHLLRAIEISPYNKWAYYHLGEMYRQVGDLLNASEYYKKSLEIDDQFALALEQLYLVDQIMSR